MGQLDRRDDAPTFVTARPDVDGDGLPVAQMRRWYLAGESNATIGARLGLHQSKVRRVLIEAGITMRSRREQVALQDLRAGVTVPTCEELTTGYLTERLTITELGERHGISYTRTLQALRDCGIERRPGRPRPEWVEADLARRRPPELVAEIVELYESGLSPSATARRVGVHKATVTDVLRREGVELRDRRKLPPVEHWAHRYTAGETDAQIAATYGAQPEAVYRAMDAAGIERRPAGARGRPLRDDDVLAVLRRPRSLPASDGPPTQRHHPHRGAAKGGLRRVPGWCAGPYDARRSFVRRWRPGSHRRRCSSRGQAAQSSDARALRCAAVRCATVSGHLSR